MCKVANALKERILFGLSGGFSDRELASLNLRVSALEVRQEVYIVIQYTTDAELQLHMSYEYFLYQGLEIIFEGICTLEKVATVEQDQLESRGWGIFYVKLPEVHTLAELEVLLKVSGVM